MSAPIVNCEELRRSLHRNERAWVATLGFGDAEKLSLIARTIELCGLCCEVEAAGRLDVRVYAANRDLYIIPPAPAPVGLSVCECGHNAGSHNSLKYNCLANRDGTHATRCKCKRYVGVPA